MNKRDADQKRATEIKRQQPYLPLHREMQLTAGSVDIVPVLLKFT